MSDLVFYDKTGEPKLYLTRDKEVFGYDGTFHGIIFKGIMYNFEGDWVGELSEGYLYNHDGHAEYFSKGAKNGPKLPKSVGFNDDRDWPEEHGQVEIKLVTEHIFKRKVWSAKPVL